MNSVDLGASLRDLGMESVLENSGEWKHQAGFHIDSLFDFMPVGEEFIGQVFRTTICDLIDVPHHHNAWSAVVGSRIRKWLKEGRIIETGWQAGTDPRAHARRYIKYRKLS